MTDTPDLLEPSAGPAAEEVRRRILTDIREGALQSGQRLGGERDLAKQYGVSRSTLRGALDTLQRAGVVRRTPGRGGGTFISHGKVERDLSRVAGVPGYLRRQGFEAGTRVLSTSVRAADAETTRRLQLVSGDMVFELVRLRLADGQPISLERARLVADFFPGLLELSLAGSVYDLLSERYGVVPHEVTEEIEIVAATADESKVLEVEEGAPLMSVLRTGYSADGAPFELSHDLFRADRTRVIVRTKSGDERLGAGGVQVHAI